MDENALRNLQDDLYKARKTLDEVIRLLWVIGIMVVAALWKLYRLHATRMPRCYRRK